jgi:hypothetical protein
VPGVPAAFLFFGAMSLTWHSLRLGVWWLQVALPLAEGREFLVPLLWWRHLSKRNGIRGRRSARWCNAMPGSLPSLAPAFGLSRSGAKSWPAVRWRVGRTHSTWFAQVRGFAHS